MVAARRAIRVWLAERGKTQEWLARKSRLHATTLSRVLTGDLPATDAMVAKLERVTGINIRDLAKVA